MYTLDDRWLDTVPLDVFACNRVTPTWGDNTVAVYAAPEDTVDVWFALHDTRRLASDKNLLGIIRAFMGSGPEHDVAVQDTPAINDSRESEGGIRFANVIVEYVRVSTDTVVASKVLTGNKLHDAIVPQDVLPSFGAHESISIRVTVGYEIEANSVLDQRTELREITILGPEIRHG